MNLDLLKRGYWDEAGDGGDDGGSGDGGTNSGGSDGGSGGGSGEGANNFADTWREDYASGDESKLSQLSRYASPNSAFDALIAAKQKISSGEFKSTAPFPTDGDESAQNEWREANGIPLKAEKYDLSLSNGRTVGEDDKPIINDFLSAAHKANMPPAQANAAVDWYFDNLETQMEARAEADNGIREATEDALRAEWGQEYRSNINRINGLIDTAPEAVQEEIRSARLPNGDPLMGNPDTLKFLADLAVLKNPATTLVPGAGDNIVGAVEDEIQAIEEEMKKPKKQSKYYSGPMHENGQDTVMAVRYRELLAAKEKLGKNA